VATKLAVTRTPHDKSKSWREQLLGSVMFTHKPYYSRVVTISLSIILSILGFTENEKLIERLSHVMFQFYKRFQLN
jgi:hypothetical protein